MLKCPECGANIPEPTSCCVCCHFHSTKNNPTNEKNSLFFNYIDEIDFVVQEPDDLKIRLCPKCFEPITSSEKFCKECTWRAIKNLLKKYDAIITLNVKTSGPDFKTDRIIELAATKLISQNDDIVIESQMDNLIKLPNGTKLNDEVSKKVQMTNEQLENGGKDTFEVFSNFVNMFKNQKVLLVTYDAHFDLRFLYYALFTEKLDNALKRQDKLDVRTIFRDRYRDLYKLESAADIYKLGEIVSEKSNALDYVYATIEVLKSLGIEYDDLEKYINIIGYAREDDVKGSKISSVEYLQFNFDNEKKLYNPRK